MKKAERSNYHFAAQQASDGKPVLVVQLYQDSIPLLKGASMGFDLLGGIGGEQAKKLAEMLNEHVLDLFLITGGESGEVG
jgi:KaiC/GvpD/RAD55 family RecA-like ATPase